MIKFANEFNTIHKKLLSMGEKFATAFPFACAQKGVYGFSDGLSWTDSFYVGMLWLDYAVTKNEKIKANIDLQMNEFETRLDENRGLDHHDIGFLYILSAVAGYKITGEERYKNIAVKAAKLLSKRYHSGAKFIQAWGAVGSKDNYRLIIDCMMNVPLLYWAAEVTEDKELYDIAYNHAKTTKSTIFRADDSTYHTYFFDYYTGEPLYGKTAQGFGNDTAWARGQAWAIYGFEISYRYTKDESFLQASEKAAKYFLKYLPEDMICYWDLCFGDGSGEPKDSSAAAIAACGFTELYRNTKNEEYLETAKKIMSVLCEKYISDENSEAIIEHGTYSKPDNFGVDEACIWGDYYFLECLIYLIYGEEVPIFW